MNSLMRIAGAVALTSALVLAFPPVASADFALSIGIPGFSFYAAPCHRPYPYAYAPAYYYPPPPPVVVYAPPPYYGYGYRHGGYGYRHGGYGYRHGGRWKTAHGYSFPGRR
jgi:hypothetical protein